jgi:hypothetical protein
MSAADPRLAWLVYERFHCNPWWTTATWDDATTVESLCEIQAKRQQREQELLHGDDLTSLLPDQEAEVA